MGSVRLLASKGTLFMDFRFQGHRLREYSSLTDTTANRKRLQKALDRIETEISLGSFDYTKTFGKPLPEAPPPEAADVAPAGAGAVTAVAVPATPPFSEFANLWFDESEVSWRRSYRVTQRGTLDKYLIPHFGAKPVGEITKADLLGFRAHLVRSPARGENSVLSNRRVNAVLKPLRQILIEAADRFSFTSPFRNIKPLKVKRSDVMPFSLDEVQIILQCVRPDYRHYFTTRFFTGMRTGEVHGLKWKYVDFERRLILVRESIVLGEEDDLKTEDSVRDIYMTQLVFEALQEQARSTRGISQYVFCNLAGNPLDNKNFNNRVWKPKLAHLGLAHRRPYQMRHTAATLWLASGEAPEWIARQLGHTSTEMLFRVYSRYVPNLTRQDGSAMERLLASKLATGQVTRLEEGAISGLPGLPGGLAQVPRTELFVPTTPAQQPVPKLRGPHRRQAPTGRPPTDITLPEGYAGEDAQPPPGSRGVWRLARPMTWSPTSTRA
jgi:integrase